MTGAAFAERLIGAGFDLFAGVPCSLVEGVIAALERHPGLPYIAAVREDVAVGVAGGAWLAGRRPAVVMQNSGLGTSLNALASFSLMYGLPALCVVTWRGHRGQDAPEHRLMGEITPGLLDLLGIPYRVLAPDGIDDAIAWAGRELSVTHGPVALVVPPKLFSDHGAEASGDARPEARPRPVSPYAAPTLTPKISRLTAIAAAMKALGDELVVCANGYPSREACAVADRPQNFYMIGSMGLAGPIGLGVALGRPDRRTVVFDGDGNVLMSLGALANVAALAPPNFIHCVFDNEVYGSTGNQVSPSRYARLDAIAAAAGYRTVAAVDDAAAVTAPLRRMLASDGPHFLLVKVTAAEANVPRIPHAPAALRDRFRAAVSR